MKNYQPMQPDPKKQDDWPIGRIIAIVVLFSIGLWPIAVYLIWKSIKKSDRLKNKPRRPGLGNDGKIYVDYEPYQAPTQSQNTPPHGQHRGQYDTINTRARSQSDATEQSSVSDPVPKVARPQKSPWWYAALSALGVATLIGGCAFSFFGLYNLIIGALFSMVSSVFLFSGIMALAGIGFLIIPRSHAQKAARKNRFVNVVGNRKVMRLDDIAATLGIPYPQTVKELQVYLDRGMFPGGYIDHARKLLVVSADGLKAYMSETEANNNTEKTAPPVDARSGLLEQIREINARIADKQVSEKIKRIETITALILDAVTREPDKEKKIAAFMGYYLPTTLKILNAYEQFEEQDVRGENIQAAMRDIENILDLLTSGFERQLDLLFESNVLDISSDISVLESMLAKDGLTDGGFTLPNGRKQ